MTISIAAQSNKHIPGTDLSLTLWDVVIVGGGPASSAAAIKLVQAGWQVLVLEHQPRRSGYGESLPPASVNLVQELLGDITVADYQQFGMRSSPGNKSSWVGAELQIFDFYSHPTGHGLCVDRQQFDHALRQRAVVLVLMLSLLTTTESLWYKALF